MGISAEEFQRIRHEYPYLADARFLGDAVEIPDGVGFWQTPISLSSYILSALKERATNWKDMPASKAVITVPAYFDESQRAGTKQAGELAGLRVLRIINEPTAACLAYGFGDAGTEAKHLIVYDLGGGTFDVSVVRVEHGIFEVLSTHGDTKLGGDDIDRSIVQHWQTKYPETKSEVASLRLIAEEAKRALSESDNFKKEQQGVTYTLTKQELEFLSAPWIDKTINSCKQALQDAGLTKSDVDQVILVGGSTRMPYVKERVHLFFQRPVNDSINPDEVVAMGAALQAAQLDGADMGHLLLDVTPLSLGIETAGGLMDVLIPRNSKIPFSVSRQYTTQRDGQTSIRISVYQGERDQIIHNRELSTFLISGIPAMPAGMAKLKITFQIDANGMLKVEAQEQRSGIRQDVVINPIENLTKDQIDHKLLEAHSHADEDKEVRAKIQLQVESKSFLLNLQKLLTTNRGWIEPAFYAELELDCQQLDLLIQQNDQVELRAHLELLEQKAKPLAEEVMNRAIGDHLRDTSI